MTTAPLRARPVATASGTTRAKDSLVRRGWVVVAPHRAPQRAGGPHPWGTAHLKLIGATHTACGEPAHGWHGFWHLDFRTDLDDTCEDCASAVRSELRSRPGDRPAAHPASL